MLKLSKIFTTFTTSSRLKPPPPPVTLKKPQNSLNQLNLGLSPSKLAEKLNLTQSIIRRQMINPKNNMISKEQLEMIGIINGTSLDSAEKFEMKKKSPVVTIMGHVDHGKTTLIDYLRKSNIAEKQYGGITQKIGAFHIQCHGEKITFIDTPGHEAFTNMRQRGAKMTDLIVLIVSGTQGVKKQTQQVINIINQKKLPCIVAINKIDLPNADPQSVERSLHQAGLQIEPFGGHIPVVHISGKTGTNVQLLSELILEQTKELKAVFDGTVEGTVLQAHKNSEGLNAVTLIIQKGVLKPGSFLILGSIYTKVKQLKDDKGNPLKIGIPGDAVEIIGLQEVPKAGQLVYEVKDQKKAKFILNKKKQKQKQQQINLEDKKNPLMTATKISFANKRQKRAFYRGFSQRWIDLYKQTQNKILVEIQRLQSTGIQMEDALLQKQEELQNHKKFVEEYLLNLKDKPNTINLIFKFSNRGIEETILQRLESVAEKIKTNYQINLNILSTGIGDITQGDAKNAKLSHAQIITFDVGISQDAYQTLNEYAISPKAHNLIHTFLKQIQDISLKKKKSCIKGIERGCANILQIYKIKKGKKESIVAAGIKVVSGKLQMKNKFYIFRGGVPVSNELQADFIKVFKKQQQEVKKDKQCTISFNKGLEGLFEKGDQIYCFEQ